MFSSSTKGWLEAKVLSLHGMSVASSVCAQRLGELEYMLPTVSNSMSQVAVLKRRILAHISEGNDEVSYRTRDSFCSQTFSEIRSAGLWRTLVRPILRATYLA